nr:upf0613 protein [Quercus suber]
MESVTSDAPSSHQGKLHVIPPNLCAFEPQKPLQESPTTNTLLWIGGMFDTLLSVTYPLAISRYLSSEWSLMTASLSSAGNSWGVSSIAKDAKEMGKIVAFIKTLRPQGKIVIMGHSTGCQDCMEYIVGPNSETRPSVNGVILQAPVSDRQALTAELPAAIMEEANQLALKMCQDGRGKDAIPQRLSGPLFGRIAITAQRWLDVSSPGPDHAGADDYFSSDLPDDRFQSTFGKFKAETPLLILHGGEDDSIPEDVDELALIERWATIVKTNGGVVDGDNSGVVPGATHNLNGDPDTVVQDLVERVVRFIGKLDRGELVAGTSI